MSSNEIAQLYIGLLCGIILADGPSVFENRVFIILFYSGVRYSFWVELDIIAWMRSSGQFERL